MDLSVFEERKRDHIRHALDDKNQAFGLSGLDRISLVHEALPELDFSELILDQNCLGNRMKTPFYISGMTAGHPDAKDLNLRLGRAAEARGWAMGVGSQRKELNSDAQVLESEMNIWKNLRAGCPRLVLFGNLGASQLVHTSLSDIERLVENIQAQAFCIHLNALQEVLQPEGTPQFKGVFNAIEKVSRALSVPVIVKETGSGISEATLKRLANSGVKAIDVSGLGGTHWGRMEGARATGVNQEVYLRAAETFRDWGVSTVDSTRYAKKVLPAGIEVWASGGVRSGLDAAKLIALGAHRVGYAKPVLEVALRSENELVEWMLQQEYELKVALFCTGSTTVDALRNKDSSWIIKE